MNLNKKIGLLLDNGFKPEFISSLTESKINFLFEKMSKRKENKEATTTTKTEKVTTYTPDELTKMKQQNTGVNVNNGEVTPTPQGGLIVKQQAEGEIKEKFESKAQQGLFWARCNKCKTDDCKWCKMAKEFSKSTSEKQYKKMPEKKHPKKTVKYKKKETNEEFTMANYYDKVASTYTNLAKSKLTKEEIINKHLTKIVESNLKPTMKKRDLLRLIESENKNKKNLNEDFYYDEMGEDFDMMSKYEGRPNWYEEDEEDYEEYDMPPGREDDDTPRPRNKMSRLSRRMNDPFAPTIDPGIKEPKIKPIEPDVEPEWQPDEYEPENPDEDEETKIQGKRNMNGPAIIPIRIDPNRKREREREIEPDEWQPDEYEPENPDEDEETKIQGKRNMEFMLEIRNKFNRTMNRLNETHYKPIKYNKY